MLLDSLTGVMIVAAKGDVSDMTKRDFTLFVDGATGKIGFRVGNGSTQSVVTSAAVTSGRWYTVTAWHNAAANTLNIQLDNGTVQSVSYSGGAMDTTYPMSVGAFANGIYVLDGRIDELSLYKRVLTATERTWLYNNGQGRSYASLGAQLHAVTSAVTNGACPQGEVCDHDQAQMGVNNSYTYDNNGNQITRTINGVTLTLAYDAEGRMVSVTGQGITATFTYDGDGKRVKSTINGTSTYFVGNHYEVSDSVITKYYYAGSQRVAMKVGASIYYLLSDHLGSTSLTTYANGSVASETRYSAWGGVRFSSGTTPTDYTFAAQYSDSYINLLDYGSRRFDPEIGRFISPDSIVPEQGQGVQAWDRYAYSNNSPVRYVDTSGYCIWNGCVVETIIMSLATVVTVAKSIEIVMFGTAPDYHGVSNAEQYVSNSGYAIDTYTAGGIAIQSNYEPFVNIVYRDSYRSGFGLAQVSRNDLDNELGMAGSDPFDPQTAIAAMEKRISLVTDLCGGRCSATDMFIAAALAQNAGFKRGEMRDLLNGAYGEPVSIDPAKAFLPWGTFLEEGNNSYNRLMLRMFKNDIQELGKRGWYVPGGIDWDYIDRLSRGGWRSSW